MRIAVIGTGNVGGTLAMGWSKRGHEVLLGARDSKSERSPLVGQRVTGKTSLTTPAKAANAAEIIVLAVPWGATPSVLHEMTDSLRGKILVDCTNPVKQWPVLDHANGSGGEQVQRMAADAKVVKAFNCTGAENMADPTYRDGTLTMFYAGEDAGAKQTVRTLIQDLDFEPVDAGGLAQSYHLEMMAALWGALAFGQKLGRNFGFRLMKR